MLEHALEHLGNAVQPVVPLILLVRLASLEFIFAIVQFDVSLIPFVLVIFGPVAGHPQP